MLKIVDMIGMHMPMTLGINMKAVVYILKTATCGKCPFVIKQAEKLLKDTAYDLFVVDLSDDSDLSKKFIEKYNVKSVPKFVVNDELVEGTIPALKKALNIE